MPPKKLHGLTVLDDGTDRDSWLKARTTVITATQTSAIAGSSPYSKPIDVWNERTDPDHDPEALRNRWLDERAKLGTEREHEIIAWATEQLGGPTFEPNSALLANDTRPGFAVTPDAIRKVPRKGLELIEAKTTQQRWDEAGAPPQHIVDQCLMQLYVTNAIAVHVAVEFYEWSGKGDSRTAKLVGHWLYTIRLDEYGERRLEFLLAKVTEFNTWMAEGIAPESDLDLAELAELDFDDDEETAADKAAMAELAADLDLIAQIDAEWTMPTEVEASRKAAEERVRKALDEFEGNRVRLISTRYTAELLRGTTTKLVEAKLPQEARLAATEWRPSKRVYLRPNPLYTPTEGTEA